MTDIPAGRVRAAARLIRLVEDDPVAARQILKQIFHLTGKAYLIGLTGSPGVGKSTLTDRLITVYREQGLKVGVLAVDPTSPFSGGALLGDRIRMQNHAVDDKVFIRSLATRGAFGGLTVAVGGAVLVLDAAGYDRIIIETVGVGQDEVDIARLAHTTVVVNSPGLGDDVQAIKAGVMEIADVMAVNKADMDGANQTVGALKTMIELNRAAGQKKPWWPEVIPCSARTADGLDEFTAGLERHRLFLTEERPDLKQAKDKSYLRDMVIDLIKEETVRQALGRLDQAAWEERMTGLARRSVDPFSLAEDLLAD